MAMSNLTIRIDDSDKKTFSEICESIGLSVSAAYNVFTKAVIRTKKIPFELEAARENDFLSPANIKYLEEQLKLWKEGKLNVKTFTLDEIMEMGK